MATLEQRVGQLEGAYQHLATKADLAQPERRLTKEISHGIRWMAGLQITGLAAIAGIVITIVQLLD